MRVCTFLLLLVLAMPEASAEPILKAGKYPSLDGKMARQGRQFYLLNALPFGLSLNLHPKGPEEVALVDQFLAQEASDDVKAVTGKHPYELAAVYGEHGDLGFFGGIAVAATAYEYMVHRRDGAAAEVLSRSRQRVVRAAKSWHLFKVVTGGGGLVARGIQKLVPEPGEPPMPVDPGVPVPLADAEGNPLPDPKDNGSWREDLSDGELPPGSWNWIDSCSKDQLVGQVFAMVALYDAMKDDPDIDQALVAQLEEDARLIGQMLMVKREISQWPKQVSGSGEYDLIIMDADGRPTMYHDLNPLSLEKFYFKPEDGVYNVFNLFMALGMVKGLLHVSGDPALEQFLYVDLMHDRDFLGKAAEWPQGGGIDYIYAGTKTNFDDPDMTGVALFLALYLENDPAVTKVLRRFLEIGWWNRAGENHTARKCKQPLWHALYLASTDKGTDPDLVQELADLLAAFPLGPYWNDAVINCDAQELSAGSCLAVDGETTLTLSTPPAGLNAMATEALDPSIRPPSDFNARSNPFEVNGGGGLRLNPGGDLQAAYWITRYMDATDEGAAHLSPFARDHMPVGGEPVVNPEASEVEGESDVGSSDVASEPDVPAPGTQDAGSDDTLDAASDGLAQDGGDPGSGSGATGSGSGCSASASPRRAPGQPAALGLLLCIAAVVLARARPVRP